MVFRGRQVDKRFIFFRKSTANITLLYTTALACRDCSRYNRGLSSSPQQTYHVFTDRAVKSEGMQSLDPSVESPLLACDGYI